MTRAIGERELRENSDELLAALKRGEAFLVTRNDVVVGELRPLPRHFAPRDVVLEAFRGAPHIDGECFRADLDVLFGDDDGR